MSQSRALLWTLPAKMPSGMDRITVKAKERIVRMAVMVSFSESISPTGM